MNTYRIIFFAFALQTQAHSDSFQKEFWENRHELRLAIGESRFRDIEKMAASTEIYRVTQLLTIHGIGEKTVAKIATVLGLWFSYGASFDICVGKRMC